jgi:hypothetical protein
MSLTIKGKVGSYTFELYPMSQTFNKVGGVYVILKYTPMLNWCGYIYVGETGDFCARFSGHHKQSCFDLNGATHIGAFVDNNEQSRKAKEADILAGGTWPCNG